MPPEPSEYVIWDSELAGFGMRVRPSGNRYWFVRLHDPRHTYASHAVMGRENLPMIGRAQPGSDRYRTN